MSNALQIYDSGFVRLMFRSREGLEAVWLAMSLITCVQQTMEGTYLDLMGEESAKGPFLNLSEEECETLMREVMITRQRESSW